MFAPQAKNVCFPFAEKLVSLPQDEDRRKKPPVPVISRHIISITGIKKRPVTDFSLVFFYLLFFIDCLGLVRGRWVNQVGINPASF